MLEVSSIAAEARLEIDFAEHYNSSTLYQYVENLVMSCMNIRSEVFQANTCDYVQKEQGSSEGFEHSYREWPLFSYTVLRVHMGAIQVLPVETMVDLLEKSRV